jgi:CheY-like chemotaxis protein
MAKILVIDDDSSVRSAARTILENAGHDVALAPDGFLGVRMFKKIRFFIVIVDLFMPDQDGIETIRYLKAENRDIKILAISEKLGENEPDFLMMAKALGADATLEKPITSVGLSECILMLRNVVWYGRTQEARAGRRARERPGYAIWRGRSGDARARKTSGDDLSNVIWRGRSGEIRVRRQTDGHLNSVIWRGKLRRTDAIELLSRPAAIPADPAGVHRRPPADPRPSDRPQSSRLTIDYLPNSRSWQRTHHPADPRPSGQPRGTRRPPPMRVNRRNASAGLRRSSAWDRLRHAVRRWRAQYARRARRL